MKKPNKECGFQEVELADRTMISLIYKRQGAGLLLDALANLIAGSAFKFRITDNEAENIINSYSNEFKELLVGAISDAQKIQENNARIVETASELDINTWRAKGDKE